jgi:hypothetical protein
MATIGTQGRLLKCLPNVGGNWNNTANAGVFYRNFNNTPSNTNNNNGARAVRLRHNHALRRSLRGPAVPC